MSQVLDAHAVFVYLEKEPGFEKVTEALFEAATTGKDLLMTSVNWGEVYDVTLKEKGNEQAEEVLKTIETFPVEVVSVDKTLAKQAGLYKATRRMSYADCFSAALAKLRKATLLTGDPEFKEVEKEIKILWLE